MLDVTKSHKFVRMMSWIICVIPDFFSEWFWNAGIKLYCVKTLIIYHPIQIQNDAIPENQQSVFSVLLSAIVKA